MKIRPRNIPKFDGGGGFDLDKWIRENTNYYNWYSSLYPNAQKLQGDPLKQRNNYWNKQQLSSSHYTTDDLRRSAYNNYLYTNDYEARNNDLIRWAESLSDFGTISDQDFVNRYNTQALKIRDAREAPLTYNRKGYADSNRTFRNMFYNRSRQGTNTPLYTIGYLENLDDIEGTSTWQRRMDRYLTPFDLDTPEGLQNRTFYITRPDGRKIKVYKKENGDIGLFNDEEPTLNGGELPEVVVSPGKQTEVPIGHKDKYGFDWDKIREGALKIFGNPNFYAFGRLAGNLINNERVFDETIKGIKPTLLSSYYTHRQVVGDEATKQAYYRRAAQGQTKAARPFTSDADKLMAYQYEAKRIGDELRAQGDLADNQEIRRTSDESNQHEWANTQRATEVANTNRESINKANAMIHNLIAQKHSAQWSSIDNFLKGIEYRKRQQLAENQAIDDEIFALSQQNELLNDTRLNDAYNKYLKTLEKHKLADDTYDYDNEEVKTASREYKSLAYQIQIENYRKRKEYLLNRSLINHGFGYSLYGKSGTKITRKKKDDLLYKSTRDVVEHFRKMSKISSDALDRKQPKIQKLAPHPKGSTKKYLYGGVAPFTVYTPIGIGGETSTTTSYDSGSARAASSSKKGSDKNETLDMIKELFKMVVGKGLPSDVNSLYKNMKNFLGRANAFGTELSTDDIASMYLSLMQQLNQIEYLKVNHDKAKEIATSNDAINEIAVNSIGLLVALNTETGKIQLVNSVADAKEKGLTLLTNDLLLQMRAIDPTLAGRHDLDGIAANGIGLSKIVQYIKSIKPNVGTTELTSEGYTKVEAGKIKAGFELLQDAPAGVYSYTDYTKEQLGQMKAALKYILLSLPTNMTSIMKAHADLNGVPVTDMIMSLLSSEQDFEQRRTYTALTGKAAKDANGNSKEDDKIKSNFLDLVQRDQIGIDREFSMITKDGNTKLYSLNSKYISQLPNVSEDMSIEKMLAESKIGSIMDSRLGVTFGDLIISPENFKDIMFDPGGGATIVTLPCKYENGHKVVNFAIKDEFDDAIKEASKVVPVDYSNPKFNKVLSNKLHEKGLDSLLNGDNLDPKMFGHFIVVSAYATDKIKFNTNSRYVEKVRNPDKSLELRIIKGLSTNKDKNDYELDINDKFGLFELTYDDVYRGNIFIPLNNDPVSALTGWGNDDIKLGETQNLAELYLNYQKSSKQKESSSSKL